MRIKLLKLLDRVAGRLAALLLPAARQHPLAQPRRFLLIRPGGIGDAVLLIPAILALKQRFPEAEISVLAERRNGAAFALCPAVDSLLLYDNLSDLGRAIRGGYDVVIDTEQWHRLSAVVSRLCGAPVSIGFATNERSRLFSSPVPYSQDAYEIDSFFHLLAPLGIEAPDSFTLPFLKVPQAAGQQGDHLLKPLQGARFVVLFPGASVKEKRWGGDRFYEVARFFAARGVQVVVVGGNEDMAEGRRIMQGVPGLNLAGGTSLVETAAVIERAALVISGDSGVLHLAVGLGRPTVSLFGPGSQAKWGPKGKHHQLLNRWLPCAPCTRFGTIPPCPFDVRCLSDITVDEVIAAVGAQLGMGQGRRRH